MFFSGSEIYANVEHIFVCDMPIIVTLITFGRAETRKHQYTYCTQLDVLALAIHFKYLVVEGGDVGCSIYSSVGACARTRASTYIHEHAKQ